MSNPAVTFGCPLLPSTVADPPSILGLRARRRFADPKGTAQLGVGLLISSSENSIMAKFAEFFEYELPRIPIPRTRVNRASPRPDRARRHRRGSRSPSGIMFLMYSFVGSWH